MAIGYVSQKSATAKDDDATAKARREACEDTLWALLNTKEFQFNH